MSNVIKFERPPEPKEPKEKTTRKQLSPTVRRMFVWVGVVAAFGLAWIYFTVAGA